MQSYHDWANLNLGGAAKRSTASPNANWAGMKFSNSAGGAGGATPPPEYPPNAGPSQPNDPWKGKSYGTSPLIRHAKSFAKSAVKSAAPLALYEAANAGNRYMIEKDLKNGEVGVGTFIRGLYDVSFNNDPVRLISQAIDLNRKKEDREKSKSIEAKPSLDKMLNLPAPSDTSVEHLLKQPNKLPHSPVDQRSPLVGDPQTVKPTPKKKEGLQYSLDDKGRIAISGTGYDGKAVAPDNWIDAGNPEANKKLLETLQNSRGTVSQMPMYDWSDYNRRKAAQLQADYGYGYDYVPEINTRGSWGDFINSVNARNSALGRVKRADARYKLDQESAAANLKAQADAQQNAIKNARAERQFRYDAGKDAQDMQFKMWKALGESSAKKQKNNRELLKSRNENYAFLQERFGDDANKWDAFQKAFQFNAANNKNWKLPTQMGDLSLDQLNVLMPSFDRWYAAQQKANHNYIGDNDPITDFTGAFSGLGLTDG